MNYFILTRFNLRLFTENKHRERINKAEWLVERFDLFERYCLPSVMNQSVKEFKWICLFDSDTPQIFRKRIQGYVKQMPNFIPCFLDMSETAQYRAYFKQKVLELGDEKERLLVTTYLDNDDMLHRDYVKRVEEYALTVNRNTIVSFNYGIQHFTETGLSTEIWYRNNHFLSFIERFSHTRPVFTVWEFSHYYLGLYKVNVIDDTAHRDLWVEVIHGGNVDNDVKMTWHHTLVRMTDSLTNYGVDLSLQHNMLYFITHFYPRWAQQILRRARNKITKYQIK